jgi:hypothetical protein
MNITTNQITLLTATVFIVAATTAVAYYEFKDVNEIIGWNPKFNPHNKPNDYRPTYNASESVHVPRYSEEFDRSGYDANRYARRDSMPSYDPFQRTSYKPTIGGTRCCNCQTRLRYTRRK